MKPYYEEAGITIYHGDCKDVLPLVVADVVISDPPYGLNLGDGAARSSRYGGHLGKAAYLTYEDSYENFVGLVVPAISAAIGQSRNAAIFTGPHIHEQKKPTAIGGVFVPNATGRTPWGSKNFLPILFYGNPPLAGTHRPTVIRSTDGSVANGHPCPKPLSWMKWLVGLASMESDTILDPFAGSGTTLVAAKDLGRKAIGIDIEEAYCEIAANRLRQSVLNFEGVA